MSSKVRRTETSGGVVEAPRLEVTDLRVAAADRTFAIVDEVSFSLEAGRTLAIVGESGSGKTTVAMALLGFARAGTAIAHGRVAIGGADLLALPERERRRRRGRDIAYVPQDPATALSPAMRIGAMLREMLEVHGTDGTDAPTRIADALREAQLPSDSEFQRRYPYQLSGGQQQRVAIALALICRPGVVVMDEPTTGLDVTTQARLLEVVGGIVRESDVALVYVSHDLGVVRNLADRVAVMYGGRIVESGPVGEIFANPRHPYTRRLLEAVPRVQPTAFQPREIPGTAIQPSDWPPGCPFAPRCEYRSDACDVAMPSAEAATSETTLRCVNWRRLPDRPLGLMPVRVRDAVGAADDGSAVLLRVNELTAGYGRIRSRRARGTEAALAVAGVSFEVRKGTCTAIVGESGSGKTTTLRCIAGLHAPASGAIAFDGVELAAAARARTETVRQRIQLVPQNPDSSLNPRRLVEEIVGRPLTQFFGLRGQERRKRVAELLARVHLPVALSHRYPKELSGGEKQRVAIARALAAEPEVLLCDEISAALDVAVQAGILELLEDLRVTLRTTLVFVSHDLAVVRSISDEIVVMEAGTIRERGSTGQLFAAPRAPYTRALLAAVPDLRPTDYPGLTGPRR